MYLAKRIKNLNIMMKYYTNKYYNLSTSSQNSREEMVKNGLNENNNLLYNYKTVYWSHYHELSVAFKLRLQIPFIDMEIFKVFSTKSYQIKAVEHLSRS